MAVRSMGAKKASESSIVQSVDHAIDIIEFLYSTGHEVSIREINAGIGMAGSTIHRQLLTLKERGYIYQNPENSKYWLGLRFYALGNIVQHNLPIVHVLSPYVDALANKYSLTAYIVLPDYSSDLCAQQAIVYRKSYSLVVLRNEAAVGTVMVAHGSASGKCMMSYYPESLIQQYSRYPLLKMTEKTITDWIALKAEFSSIRSRGYALDSDEEEDGRTCLAVPVLDSSQNIIASISVSGQTKSIFDNPVNQIIKDLNDVAKVVNSKI